MQNRGNWPTGVNGSASGDLETKEQGIQQYLLEMSRENNCIEKTVRMLFFLSMAMANECANVRFIYRILV